MSRTKNAAELCALLVEETFGELTCRIFTLLLRRGRQSIAAITQHTRLPPRHVRNGLAVLVQHNLVYWHTEHDSEITFYEANQNASYFLLRSGKIIEYVSFHYEPSARGIVQNLLFLGQAKISDLLAVSKSVEQPVEVHINGDGKSKPLANGIQNGPRERIEGLVSKNLEDVMFQLLESGLVAPVVKAKLQSPSDLYNQVEREVLKDNFQVGIKGTKQKDELKARMVEKLREIRSESEGCQQKGVKRAFNGVHINGGEKRRKLNNGVEHVDSASYAFHSESNRLELDLNVKINYEKCDVLLRNQQLVALVKGDLGETTSHVYSTLLKLLEGRIPRCQLDPTLDDLNDIDEGPVVSTMELARALDKSVNPSFGIGKVDSHSIRTTNLEKPQRKRKRGVNDSEATVEGDASSDEDENSEELLDDVDEHGNIPEVIVDSDSDGEDPFAEPLTKAPAVKPPSRKTKVTFDDKLPKPASREAGMNKMKDIKNHLLLLADYSPHFVRKCGSRGLGEWTVDFDELVSYMRETELDDFIFETFGVHGCRIARMLRQKGKLEEKQIQKFGLLKLKDVRTKLLEMQMSGIVDIQEVPKDSTRAAGRTIFLWYFDSDRVKMIALEHIYKTMSRFLQVLKAEKYDERDILSQAKRTDVVGQESEVLSSERLQRLNEIRDKEKRIFTQIGRLDTLVAIFKDF